MAHDSSTTWTLAGYVSITFRFLLDLFISLYLLQSYNRYLFDLDLLEQDWQEMPDDPHVLYYLGATKFAALEVNDTHFKSLFSSLALNELTHEPLGALGTRRTLGHTRNVRVDIFRNQIPRVAVC